jgi:hypothetical protein
VSRPLRTEEDYAHALARPACNDTFLVATTVILFYTNRSTDYTEKFSVRWPSPKSPRSSRQGCRLTATVEMKRRASMPMPGFSAEISIYRASTQYRRSRSIRDLSDWIKIERVYMQKPNGQNTPGGNCYAHISGTFITGTYDSLGRCCTYPANGFPFCIDCDTDKCYDRKPDMLGGNLTSGTFRTGVFARF